MYALLRGVDGLSAGTRVEILTHPIVSPVRVRTMGKIPTVINKRWKDQYGITHSETVVVASQFVEVETPCDNLVKLRARTR
jgi:hypothetical protein